MATTNRTFQTVPNDLLQVQMYTLDNGLRLFMSVKPDEPRIFTNIAVRAGSKHDPADTTGLAHYMEHMLFKGTSKIGALDWEKESKLLEQIAELYEQHRKTTDPAQRKTIYAEIDRISQDAARLVAPNEYDRLLGAMGANHTNAYTWVEQTVYVNDIPSNELERWFKLESERFRIMALRLFHTELETVYEEFNINQDKDFRKVNQVVRKHLFPNHPYGTQTTIGSAKDLRNPSMHNIQRFFQQYYKPNNMALILAGDFNPNQVVDWAEFYFGSFQPQEIPPFSFTEQPQINQPIRETVLGQEAEHVLIAWRFEGATTEAPFMLSLLKHLLYNEQAGILDLHLNQQQKLLESEAWVWYYEDYHVFGLYGKPREGQSLEEVEALLLQEIDRLKKGEFPDWLLEAVIKDFKLGEIRASESNQARVNQIAISFILGIPWDRFSGQIEWMEGVNKEQVITYAREHLLDNYITVHKKQGEDPNVIKVKKPPITSVELQRGTISDFGKEFLRTPTPRMEPQFIDFNQRIQKGTLHPGLHFEYVENPHNPLFQINYIFEMGKLHDPELPIAIRALPYLGTDQYSPSELQQAFFKSGLHFDARCDDHRTYITISGLEESAETGARLVEHVLRRVQSNPDVLFAVVSDILQQRSNVKKERQTIVRDALTQFARYGADSPYQYRLNEQALKGLKSEAITEKLRSLFDYPHSAYYFGQQSFDTACSLLAKAHPAPDQWLSIPAARDFEQLPTPQNEVFFVDFPIVQADVLMVSRTSPQFELDEHCLREWYNNYFGFGLSSIVFQEIRESKALAYHTYAYYSSPKFADHSHYLHAYVGTQPDKLQDALPALLQIIRDMPAEQEQMENAREALLRQMESERTKPKHIYWQAIDARDKGFERDLRQDIYQRLQSAKPNDLLQFQQEKIRNQAFRFMVLGSKAQIDLNYLEQFGPVKELSLEDVFGF